MLCLRSKVSDGVEVAAAVQEVNVQNCRERAPNALHLALHFEALLPQHLGNLVVTIFCEIYLFFVVTILVEHHEDWVMMLDPLNVEILPLLVALLLLQPPTHLSEMV